LEEETRVPGENHQPTTRFHRIVGLIFLFYIYQNVTRSNDIIQKKTGNDPGYRIQVTCSVEFVILALPVLKQETERLKKMVGE
jgi:hypothetical protein